MSYYPDLSNSTMIDEGPHVRAVGWLSPDHEYTRGNVDDIALSKITLFAENWGKCVEDLLWPVCAGFHTCEFCEKSSSSGNIGIPSGEILYVAPQMLPHYIEEHNYLPPKEFLKAVIESPLPGTEDYHSATKTFREINQKKWERLEKENC